MGRGLFLSFPSAIRHFLAKLTGCIASSSVVLSSALPSSQSLPRPGPNATCAGCRRTRCSRPSPSSGRAWTASAPPTLPCVVDRPSIVLSTAGAVHQVRGVQRRALQHPSRTLASDRASSSAIDGDFARAESVRKCQQQAQGLAFGQDSYPVQRGPSMQVAGPVW